MAVARTVWLQDMRWPEIEAHLAVDDVILVPIGATEQHGRHLPLSVDTGWAVASSEIAARRAQALVAPALPYGWSPHHMGYPGTVTLGAETLKRVTVDVGLSLIHHGFRRVILVNGNRIANLQPLEIAAVELIHRTDAHVVVADTGLIARHAVKALCEAPDGGLDHAGEAETSFALHWASDHVDMGEAKPPMPRNDIAPASAFDYPIELDPALNGDAVSRFVTPAAHRAATAPDGSLGDARAATAGKGHAMIEAIADRLVVLIEEVRRTTVGETHAGIPF